MTRRLGSEQGDALRGYGSIRITNLRDDVDNDIAIAPETTGPSRFSSGTRLLLVAAATLAALLLMAAVENSASDTAMSPHLLRPVALEADLADPVAAPMVVGDDGRYNMSADTWVPLYYRGQRVDHSDPRDRRTFSMKYFERDDFFRGPGAPIFVVLGGEDPMTDLITPFVYINLAQKYGAATIGIEHRFFGDSYPVRHPTDEDLQLLLTPRQATDDFAQLIQWYRQRRGCSLYRRSRKYCPVITVAGSYPGFLSAMLRLDYPEVVDIGYASSAPLNLYGHHTDPNAYYDYVTRVAEDAVPGCAGAVRAAVYQLHDYLTADGTAQKTVPEYAAELAICPDGIPTYIIENEDPQDMFWTELNAIIVSHFAEANMGYYPPGPATELERACRIFLAQNETFQERVGKYLTMRSEWQATGCFDMHSELPAGKRNASISSSDWSGMGDGPTSEMWEKLSCQLLPALSQGPDSMFYPRSWSEDWVTQKCTARFGYAPDFPALERDFGFDDLSGVTHLLFVNGLRDGWSRMSILVPPPGSGVAVVNVPSGAHCKDFYGPGKLDTLDMVQAHKDIDDTIGRWLLEIEADKKHDS